MYPEACASHKYVRRAKRLRPSWVCYKTKASKKPAVNSSAVMLGAFCSRGELLANESHDSWGTRRASSILLMVLWPSRPDLETSCRSV